MHVLLWVLVQVRSCGRVGLASLLVLESGPLTRALVVCLDLESDLVSLRIGDHVVRGLHVRDCVVDSLDWRGRANRRS